MSDFFPDKFTPLERTVVGEAAALLALLNGRTVSIGQLYIEHRQTSAVSTYDGFIAALTLLYGAGALDYEDQMVRTG